jgi:hypothetical protein
MKKVLRCVVGASLLIFISACSKNGMSGVLEDISRDTYEKNARTESIEKIFDTSQRGDEPLTYDQYQRERQKLVSKPETKLEAER